MESTNKPISNKIMFENKYCKFKQAIQVLLASISGLIH